MIHKTCGFLAAILLFTLVPTGCTPRPAAPKAPKVEAAPPSPPREAAALPTTLPPPASTPLQPAAVTRLRIVAWNLEWFPGHKPNPTPEAEATHLAVATAALGGNLEAVLEGKNVVMTGNIDLYKNAPELLITAPSQIRVVK